MAQRAANVELPVDGRRATAIVVKVWERRRWEGEGDDRKRSDEQAVTKQGMPMWDVVCYMPGVGEVTVLLWQQERPELRQGEQIVFNDLKANVYVTKAGGLGVNMTCFAGYSLGGESEFAAPAAMPVSARSKAS